MLGGCTLSEFDSNATDFVEKIKEFPGGAGDKIVSNTENFVKRIRSQAKLFYSGTTKVDWEITSDLSKNWTLASAKTIVICRRWYLR